MKLVVADHLGLFLDVLDRDNDLHSRLLALAVCDAHLLEIFADLYGYTNLALGIGLVFGIEGPPNFNAPFAAASIEEFWARWHMSLTGWLRDYVYIPVRFGLRRWKGAGMALSLVVTMVLIGLWHGFTTGCLAFGLLHGGFMAFSALTLGQRDRLFAAAPSLARLRRPLGILITFHWVSFTQEFVRASTISGGLHELGRLTRAASPGDWADAGIPARIWLLALVGGATALLVGAGVSLRPLKRLALSAPWLSYALALIAIVLLSVSDGRPFIYANL